MIERLIKGGLFAFAMVLQLCVASSANANMITIADGPNILNTPEGSFALIFSRLPIDFPSTPFSPLAVEALYNVNNKKIGYFILSASGDPTTNPSAQIAKEWILIRGYGRLGPVAFSEFPKVLTRSVQPLDEANFPSGNTHDFYFNPLSGYGGNPSTGAGGDLARYAGQGNLLIRCFQDWVIGGNPANGQAPVPKSRFTGALSGTQRNILNNCSIIAPASNQLAILGMSHCVELFSGASGKYGGMDDDDDN